jgi:hypothetical protein
MNMDEAPIDLIFNADPGGSPMPPMAWLLLAVMVGLSVWAIWLASQE